MTEREIVLIGGLPGTGKTTLGRNMAHNLQPRRTTEHISSGDLIRSIGQRSLKSHYSNQIIEHLNSSDSLKPLPNEIMEHVIDDALSRSGDTSLILLDGYPRRIGQIDHLHELVNSTERDLKAMIITQAPDNMAIERLLRRPTTGGRKTMNIETATQRYYDARRLFDPLLYTLWCERLPSHFVDTTRSSNEASMSALFFLDYYLNTPKT